MKNGRYAACYPIRSKIIEGLRGRCGVKRGSGAGVFGQCEKGRRQLEGREVAGAGATNTPPCCRGAKGRARQRHPPQRPKALLCHSLCLLGRTCGPLLWDLLVGRYPLSAIRYRFPSYPSQKSEKTTANQQSQSASFSPIKSQLSRLRLALMYNRPGTSSGGGGAWTPGGGHPSWARPRRPWRASSPPK